VIGESNTERFGGRRILVVLAVLLALAATGCSTELPQNSLNPAGPEARKIDDLFWLVFWIAAVIFFLVEGALIYVTLRFRRRRNQERPVKQVHGNVRLELIWTMIPAVILAAIAVPTVATIFDLRREPAPDENALIVNVIGHQWWWEFEYPEYGIETANEMHIPAGRTVYLNITSADVIHSFWVPQLNGKRDAVPGRINHLTLIADEPGLYLGQCAEFCGLAHADMRHRVYADTEEGFTAWVAEQQAPAVVPEAGPAAAGWETFQIVCAACHVADGASPEVSREITAAEGGETFVFDVALAPNLTHFGSRETFGGASFENIEEHLRDWLAEPEALKPMRPDRNDIAGGRILGMPNFGLAEDEIDGLIALLEVWQ
jgi:cytochrome c oxidase subunit 2